MWDATNVFSGVISIILPFCLGRDWTQKIIRIFESGRLLRKSECSAGRFRSCQNFSGLYLLYVAEACQTTTQNVFAGAICSIFGPSSGLQTECQSIQNILRVGDAFRQLDWLVDIVDPVSGLSFPERYMNHNLITEVDQFAIVHSCFGLCALTYPLEILKNIRKIYTMYNQYSKAFDINLGTIQGGPLSLRGGTRTCGGCW